MRSLVALLVLGPAMIVAMEPQRVFVDDFDDGLGPEWTVTGYALPDSGTFADES